ncbi:MAG: hypothetical protein WBR26_10815 [Candidatus Acidiferrum sp.]
MGIAVELLGLRERHFSSVTALLRAIERVQTASPEKSAGRVFAAVEAADTVLTNVAAHAAEALNEMTIRGDQRAIPRSRRTRWRCDAEHPPNQRKLFAYR